jgi:hypothetical protein
MTSSKGKAITIENPIIGVRVSVTDRLRCVVSFASVMTATVS